MLASIGFQEGGLILLAIVVLFGARKLPELGKSLGEGIREFRKSTRGLVDDDKTFGDKSDQ